MSDTDLYITVIVVSLSLLALTAVLFLLMIAGSNRRHRHRAELAELRLQRDAELRRAEREATEHTLTEVGRELHDNVGQLLTVAQVGLLDHLEEGAKGHPRVATALEALDQGMEEVRRLGRSLNRDHWQQPGPGPRPRPGGHPPGAPRQGPRAGAPGQPPHRIRPPT